MSTPPPRPSPSGTTYHLVPRVTWEAHRDDAAPYTPEAFVADGFVHCTDGLDELVLTANRYYTAAPGEFLALEIDLDQVAAPVRYDADPCIYPHVYGPIDRAAVTGEFVADRDDDGTFTGFRPIG